MIRAGVIGIAVALSGCVLVGPKVTASSAIAPQSDVKKGYGAYLQAERTIEDLGYARILLMDSEGRQTRVRSENQHRITSSFGRPSAMTPTEQIGVSVHLDKATGRVNAELWQLPPRPRLSDEALNEFRRIKEALGRTVAEFAEKR